MRRSTTCLHTCLPPGEWEVQLRAIACAVVCCMHAGHRRVAGMNTVHTSAGQQLGKAIFLVTVPLLLLLVQMVW